MKLLIPSLFFIALVYICYYLVKEYKKRKRLEMIKAFKEMETRYIIEKVVMRDLLHCEKWWLEKSNEIVRSSFNREKYVEYLESK